MKKKVISTLLVLALGVSLVACSQDKGSSNHNDGEPDGTTVRESVVVDKKANKDYFIFNEYESTLQLSGLTEEGKKQETLVIPANVEICCSLSDGIVKHVSFESDDDIDLKSLLTCSDTIETIILPANLTKLTSIDNCPNLKEITIPKGVTEITDLCFVNDISLETVTIEGEITRIGVNAFKKCESLKNINIPDSVSVIDNYAFSECMSLDTVTLPKGLKVIGDSAFNNKKTGIETLIVPEEVELEKCGRDAFDQWDSEYTVKVVKESWADIHFDELFNGNVTKAYV